MLRSPQELLYKDTLQARVCFTGNGEAPQHTIHPTDKDKWVLLYTKTYPNAESIPDAVP